QVSFILGLSPKERFEKITEARKLVAEMIGGLILIAGLFVTIQNLVSAQKQAKAASEQVEIARISQLSERFQKAVSSLQDGSAEAIGGLYTLQQVALENRDLDVPVTQV